jgi:hypothetical protein
VANLYGVANPVILPAAVQTLGAANVVCAAGSWTTVATSPALQAISSGVYYPSVLGMLGVSSGATQITSLQIGMHVGAGAVQSILAFSNAYFAASSNVLVPVALYGAPAVVPWQGLGSTLSLDVQPAGQAVTALFFGTYLWMSLYRAPDA